MVELKIVKEQYERMPDDELIRFAKNESQSLTLEAFHLLKSEFETRKLDIGVLESVQVDRELAEATKLSNFEKQTASEFTETIWKFAFDEKEKGKSNKEIYNLLLKKNIAENYAYMLIESIEPRSRELVDSFDTEIIVGWVVLIIGALLLLLTLNSTSQIMFLLWGSALAIGGIARLSRSYIKKRKFQTIVKNIESEKEEQNSLFQ